MKMNGHPDASETLGYAHQASLPDAQYELSPEDFTQEPEEMIEGSAEEQTWLDAYTSGAFQQEVAQLEQTLRESIENMIYENQDDEQLAEILPALIPIITAIAPAVIQGVSSLISNASRRRSQPRRQAPPARSAPQQTVRPQPAPARQVTRPRPAPLRQQPQPTPSARQTPQPAPSVSPATGPAPQTSQDPINQLLSLLSNLGVMNLIQQAASGGGSGSVPLGNERTEVSLDSVLHAISQYAQMASEDLGQENQTETAEYLLDAEGNFQPEALMELIREEED